MAKHIDDGSVEQHRINRINHLLDRLDRIPGELDTIHERIMRGNITTGEFLKLTDRRRALYIEQERNEQELKEAFKIRK